MIPTFVITLREGVEASLIVGIIAAFLVKEGRRDAMRQMWVGVAIAIALCVGVAVILEVVGQDLPQQPAGGAGDRGRPDRRRRRHLHDRLDAAQRPRDQGDAGGRGRLGAGRRLDHGARRDGLPRGPARGPGDLGLPARRLPELDRHDRRRRRRGARVWSPPSRSGSGSTAAASASTSAASSASPASSSSSSPPACWRPPPTPPTRRAGSTACRARRSTSPGWSSRGRSPARC